MSREEMANELENSSIRILGELEALQSLEYLNRGNTLSESEMEQLTPLLASLFCSVIHATLQLAKSDPELASEMIRELPRAVRNSGEAHADVLIDAINMYRSMAEDERETTAQQIEEIDAYLRSLFEHGEDA